MRKICHWQQALNKPKFIKNKRIGGEFKRKLKEEKPDGVTNNRAIVTYITFLQIDRIYFFLLPEIYSDGDLLYILRKHRAK